jgi:hypothetical protein
MIRTYDAVAMWESFKGKLKYFTPTPPVGWLKSYSNSFFQSKPKNLTKICSPLIQEGTSDNTTRFGEVVQAVRTGFGASNPPCGYLIESVWNFNFWSGKGKGGRRGIQSLIFTPRDLRPGSLLPEVGIRMERSLGLCRSTAGQPLSAAPQSDPSVLFNGSTTE